MKANNTARRLIEPLERAAHLQDNLLDEPVLRQSGQAFDRRRAPLPDPPRSSKQKTDRLVVEPKATEQIVELPRHSERPVVTTRFVDGFGSYRAEHLRVRGSSTLRSAARNRSWHCTWR